MRSWRKISSLLAVTGRVIFSKPVPSRGVNSTTPSSQSMMCITLKRRQRTKCKNSSTLPSSTSTSDNGSCSADASSPPADRRRKQWLRPKLSKPSAASVKGASNLEIEVRRPSPTSRASCGESSPTVGAMRSTWLAEPPAPSHASWSSVLRTSNSSLLRVASSRMPSSWAAERHVRTKQKPRCSRQSTMSLDARASNACPSNHTTSKPSFSPAGLGVCSFKASAATWREAPSKVCTVYVSSSSFQPEQTPTCPKPEISTNLPSKGASHVASMQTDLCYCSAHR
mmetsp:Transcript_11402/g.40446  ORF Transcript_11402/g.40446 Transcript_11402/m.40446 type:complete len:283 (-) Transcript_11402:71-919(-)